MSILYRKSWQDIRHRWARSLFTVATIAASVVGISMFALPPLMDRAMEARIASDRLHDIQVFTDAIELTDEDLAALAEVPGVEALEARATFRTEVRIGDRREDLVLVGIRDFAGQRVNVVSLQSGRLPGPGEVLSEEENSRGGRLPAGVDTVQIQDTGGGLHEVVIGGTGSTLQYSQYAIEGVLVFYAPIETVHAVADTYGYDRLDVRVTEPQEAEAVARSLQAWLVTNHPEVVFSDLPDVRLAGTWPGQDVFENFSTLFYVGAILALISAIALISNTMTTMVAEQRREIAIMKAIGGRRCQIGFAFLRTVVLLAAVGSVAGVLIGIPFSNYLARFVGNEFLGIQPGWGVSWPVIGISLLVGMLGAVLAALPALVRAARTPVHQALTSSVATPGGTLTRLLRHVPLPRAASIGLRNVARRKTRALGTMVQVGLAVGVALGFLALGTTVAKLTSETWDTASWDVIVFQSSNVALDERAGRLLQSLDGIEEAEPQLYNNLSYDGTQYEAWGIAGGNILYEPAIIDGRWLTPEDSETRAKVAVVGRALASAAGVGVGVQFALESARGPVQLTVVGIDSRLMNNGTGIFLPFETFQEVLGRTDTNAYWLASSSKAKADIDRLAARAEDALQAAGYPVGTEIRYVERDANVASNRMLVGVLAVMGIPIVAIGLIGLVNMMTMNVIERTREIGILRCIGAGKRDITRIFRAEALVVALAGWILAVPMGWLIGKALVEIVANLFNFGALPYTFPLWYPPIALALTVLLAWLVVIPPLRRASHLRPGDALRYE